MPRSILIADDSVTIRRVVELAFSDTDVRVESAGTGAEAIGKFASLRPDVVLADVVMPEPAGYDVCLAVKGSERPVPVLLLAGTFEPFDAERARACGADGHLVKPFDSRTLVAQVMRLLDAPPAPAAVRAPVPEPSVSAPAPAEDDLESVFDVIAGVAATPAAAAPGPEPAPARGASSAPARSALGEAEIDAIARRVVERLSDRVLREIAWDVVPDLAEAIIRERVRQLERDDEVR